MRKLRITVSFVLIFIIVSLCALCVVDHTRMKNNQPVVFSTWGKKYAPTEITQQRALENAMEMLDKKSKETITNLDDPKIEEIVFDEKTSIYCLMDEDELIGKSLYKITFNTTQDGLLGPIVFYVDKSSGEIAGMGYRE